MKKDEAMLSYPRLSQSRSHTHTPSFMALALCLVLGTSLFSGCALGAAVGAMTAVTEAGVLAETAWNAIRNQDEPECVVVKDETEAYSGPGEEYPRIATLPEGAEILVLGHEGDWIEFCCDECEDGWIHCSCVPDM